MVSTTLTVLLGVGFWRTVRRLGTLDEAIAYVDGKFDRSLFLITYSPCMQARRCHNSWQAGKHDEDDIAAKV
jgi:hypothetical protein